MKKMLCLSLAMVIVLANIFVYSYMFQVQQEKFLYSRQTVSITYSDPENEEHMMDLEAHLTQFSKKYNVNIMQYEYMDENSLNVYATDTAYDSTIHLEAGNRPYSSQFISNETIPSKNANQSGVFSFPITHLKVHIYNFKQVRNVGLSDTFYFSKTDPATIDSFIKEFSVYGQPSVKLEATNYLLFFDKTLLLATVCSVLGFGLVAFFVLIQERKQIMIKELWGYSRWTLSKPLLSAGLKFSFCILGILLMALLILIVLYNRTHFLNTYVFLFVLTNLTVVAMLCFLVLFECQLTQRMNDSPSRIKEKLPFEKIHLLSAVFKGITCIILFSTIALAILNYDTLNQKLERLSFWNQTKNVYKIQVGYIPISKLNSLEYGRHLNDRCFNFYKEIKEHKGAFLINSEQFYDISRNSKNPVYSYTENVTGNEAIYSPYGRKITITPNYLKMNPITSNNGLAIEEQISDDADTLTLLVPVQYKSYESSIINAYKDYFYFQKVTVDNLYNEDLGNPVNNKSLKDLKIKIIYVISGQTYFTFNSATGDKNNEIEDPIAVIYNESIDTSEIFANLTSSTYFVDNTGGKAFEGISVALKITNVNEIRSVESVYGEANDIIARLTDKMFQQIVGLSIAIIATIILLATFVWAYYQLHVYQLTLKYILGYSSFRRNTYLMNVTLATNFIIGAVVFFCFRTIMIIPFIGLAVLFDLLFIYVLGNRFCERNLNKVLKGDFI